MRSRSQWLPVFLPILLLALFALATRYPRAEVLERARSWPVVGSGVEWLQARYAPRPVDAVAAQPAGARGEEVERVDLTDYEAIGARPFVWVPEGAVVRVAPDPDAPLEARMTATANLPLVERRGDWFRVDLGSRHGWVRMPGYDEVADPPLGSEPEPPGPLPSEPPDAERLGAARRLMAGGGLEVGLGPWTGYTDVEDLTAIARLASVADSVEEAYRRRYGLEPVGRPAEAVLLFRRESAYRSFQRLSSEIAGLPAAGHAARGLVALYAERDRPAEVAGTLVHELVHLINRRALGPALPPWLDEGLADELGGSALDGTGRLDPGRIGGEAVAGDGRIDYYGAQASAVKLGRAVRAGTLPRLEEVAALDWSAFVVSERRDLHYALSAFWLRFLLDGGDPQLAEGLRAFLASVRQGGAATTDALAERLGAGWDDLEFRYRAWLRLVTPEPG